MRECRNKQNNKDNTRDNGVYVQSIRAIHY